MYFARGGIAKPEDLALLRGVLDVYCKDRRIPKVSDEAEAAARRIILLFKNGLRDREDILRRLEEGAPNGASDLKPERNF